MRNKDIDDELVELNSAEEFLNYFDIDHDPHIVMVNRLHILQRFHDYLETDKSGPQGQENWRNCYTRHLTQAYQDFVKSDALKEKVFKVFQPQKPVFVPLEQLLK